MLDFAGAAFNLMCVRESAFSFPAACRVTPFDSYAESSYSTASDDTIAISGGANVYVRNYNICRKVARLSAFCALSFPLSFPLCFPLLARVRLAAFPLCTFFVPFLSFFILLLLQP